MKTYLHVYGQNAPHDPVVVMGDRASLAGLARAIVSLLEATDDATTTLIEQPACVDGEAYDLVVICDGEHRPTLARPYSLEAYRAPGEVWPTKREGVWTLEVLP